MRRGHVLLLLCLLSVITYLDRVCISVAGPTIQDELRITPQMWGWVVGIFSLAYGAFEIPSGSLGDRIGPHKVLTRIVLWWSAFTALTGVVTSYPLLLLVRFAFGAGEAGAYPNSSAVITRWFNPESRSRALGLIFLASQVGGAISPWLVLPLQRQYGWRMSFFVFGAIGVVWALFWAVLYRDKVSKTPLLRTPHLPWHMLLRSPNLRRIMMMSSSFAYAHTFFVAWLHTYLVRARGFTQESLYFSALPFILGAVANGLGGVAGDAAVQRFGARRGRRLVAWSGIGTGILFIALTLFTPDPYLALLWLSFACAGLNFVQPTIWAVCLDIGRQQAGAVSGSMNTASQAGGFLSSVVIGYVVQYTGSYDAGLATLLATLSVSAFMWSLIDPTRDVAAEVPLAA